MQSPTRTVRRTPATHQWPHLRQQEVQISLPQRVTANVAMTRPLSVQRDGQIRLEASASTHVRALAVVGLRAAHARLALLGLLRHKDVRLSAEGPIPPGQSRRL